MFFSADSIIFDRQTITLQLKPQFNHNLTVMWKHDFSETFITSDTLVKKQIERESTI